MTQQYSEMSCTFFSPLYINYTVLPCPSGFSLQENPPGCYCYPMLTDNGVNCNIFKSEATFPGILHSGLRCQLRKLFSVNTAHSIIARIPRWLMEYQVIQYSFNRAGRLCGGCKENYSPAIGSSHCIYCANDNKMSFLIFFAAAGLLLVFFISVLNLTVTQGMINGLIFYANIVWT